MAWVVTCKLHTEDGKRCRQFLSFGADMPEDESRRRLKEWCIRGLTYRDSTERMDERARKYPISDVRSEEVLDCIANGISEEK